MQIFIVGTVYETAQSLDPRRLWKQILETDQIIAALEGNAAWSGHPVVLMYKDHIDFLKLYRSTLGLYRNGNLEEAQRISDLAELLKPDFLGPLLYDQMKRRLYTKDKNYYSQWKDLGESDTNYYYVNGEWRKYKNGKRI